MNDYILYTVKDGDTILSIANDYNVKVIDLMTINNLDNVYYLTIGETIKIPSPNNNYRYYTVKKGDTLYSISKSNNIDLDTLTLMNGLEVNEYIYPDQKLILPGVGISAYITKEGDSFNSLKNLGNVRILNNDLYLLPEQLILYRKTN